MSAYGPEWSDPQTAPPPVTYPPGDWVLVLVFSG
jgi:hypothetical protein